MNDEQKQAAIQSLRNYLTVVIRDVLIASGKAHKTGQQVDIKAITKKINETIHNDVKKYTNEEFNKVVDLIVQKQKDMTDPKNVMKKLMT